MKLWFLHDPGQPHSQYAWKSFIIDVGLTDGGTYQVALYVLDYKIDEVERIDRVIPDAEARDNVPCVPCEKSTVIVRLSGQRRQAAEEVLDAEFKEMPRRLTEDTGARQAFEPRQCARQLRSEDGGPQSAVGAGRVSSRI